MFGRKSKNAAEAAAASAEALAADLTRVKERLEATEFAKTVLETRLEEMSTRIGDIDSGLNKIDLRMNVAEIRAADLDRLNERLSALSDRVDSDGATVPPAATPLTATPEPPPPPAAVPDATGRDDEIVDELRRRVDDLTDQLSSVDARVTSVSTELANQITELSSDIERLGEGGPDAEEVASRLSERIDAAVEEVSGSTERLAAEQARYEIQFRADLAELAERLRRPGTA